MGPRADLPRPHAQASTPTATISEAAGARGHMTGPQGQRGDGSTGRAGQGGTCRHPPALPCAFMPLGPRAHDPQPGCERLCSWPGPSSQQPRGPGRLAHLRGNLSPGSRPRWKIRGSCVCSSCVWVVTPDTFCPGQKSTPCNERPGAAEAVCACAPGVRKAVAVRSARQAVRVPPVYCTPGRSGRAYRRDGRSAPGPQTVEQSGRCS